MFTMKIKINYHHDGHARLAFWATATVKDMYFNACDDSFEDAKRKLITKVKNAFDPTIPSSEEVEI